MLVATQSRAEPPPRSWSSHIATRSEPAIEGAHLLGDEGRAVSAAR